MALYDISVEEVRGKKIEFKTELGYSRCPLVNASYSMGFDVSQDNSSGLIIKNLTPLIIGIVLMIVYLAFSTIQNEALAKIKST